MRALNVAAVVLGIAVVVAAGFKVYELASDSHRAICALRAERINGVQQSRTFLQKHPNGIQFRDGDGHLVRITRGDMLHDLERQKETVRSFRFANC